MTIGQIPLNTFQLLWTNLIMDVLGAIAHVTEPPTKGQVGSKISRTMKLFTPKMWRQIIGQTVYQIIVMLTLMFGGSIMFFESDFNLVYEPPRSKERLTLNTIMFYTFFLMNLFNMFNCRILDSSEENAVDQMNPFTKSLLHSQLFWVVIIFEFTITSLMIYAGNSEFGSALFGTTGLTMDNQIICWVLGAFSLVVNLGVKKIPMNFFNHLNDVVDLESDYDNRSEKINATI